MENKTILIALGIGAAALLLLKRDKSAKKVKDNPRMLTLPMFGKDKKVKKVRMSNPTGVCNLGSSRLSSNPPINGLNISKGNAKIGNSLLNWSLPQGPPNLGGSCPGSSPWCQSFCYAAGGQVAMQRPLYTHNLEESKKQDFADRMIGAIRKLGSPKKEKRLFRIHVSGDFYSVKYVNDWIKIAKTLAPEGWKFYTYTRCWRKEAEALVPGIQSALRTLQSQPNVNIMASTDPSTGKPPSGWREAGVDGGWTGNTVMCFAQDPRSRFKTCFECRFCYQGAKGIYLNTHGVWKNSPKKQALHSSMLREALKKGFKLAPGIEKPNPRKKRKVRRKS